ncbi:hypothetical protein M8S10_12310 [Enterobacter chuandaensis]|uniref:hypothetical protein n=1 Tax=Enterobacter chuandaensis TaxID=2497875 RepID=UPI002075A249|nr:hypothetical protein [Enterobacter chuandaensis]MCM7589595.1 hypothetical protein [Enterobacter chuandaensis]
MERTIFAEDMLHQSFLTVAHDVSMSEKINHIWCHYLSKMNEGDVPGLLRPMYRRMMGLIADFFNTTEISDCRECYFQVTVTMAELHREIIRWNALESYITSSRIEIRHR